MNKVVRIILYIVGAAIIIAMSIGFAMLVVQVDWEKHAR